MAFGECCSAEENGCITDMFDVYDSLLEFRVPDGCFRQFVNMCFLDVKDVSWMCPSGDKICGLL